MNSEDAFRHVEALLKEGRLSRLSDSTCRSKAIFYSNSANRHFGLELGNATLRAKPSLDGSFEFEWGPETNFAAQTQVVMERNPNGKNLDWTAASKLNGVHLKDGALKSSAYHKSHYKLSSGLQQLLIVDSVEALDELLDWYASAKEIDIDLQILARLKQTLLEKHPDFVRFAESSSFADIRHGRSIGCKRW